MEENKTKNTLSLRKKLFEIQKSLKTFAVTEKSAKVDAKSGQEAYKYTPTWYIVETIRKAMDDAGVMLDTNYELISAKEVEHPVYAITGTSPDPKRYDKKDMHVILRGIFTWVDVESAETLGPISVIADSANGIDKSTAGAMTLAERYFLLKFFHITTREKGDELDANDAENVPGIPAAAQRRATAAQAADASVQAAVAAYGQGYQPHPYPQQMPPTQGWRAPRSQAPQQNNYPAPPQYMQPAPVQGSVHIDENNPYIRDAVNALAFFDRGTASHRERMNQVIGNLAAAGIPCTDEAFIENLQEAAQARRENRDPKFTA